MRWWSVPEGVPHCNLEIIRNWISSSKIGSSSKGVNNDFVPGTHYEGSRREYKHSASMFMNTVHEYRVRRRFRGGGRGA